MHACAQVREGHEALRKRRLDEFMAGFNAISLKLKEMYQMITLGGDAELELVDSLDPFSEVGGLPFSCPLVCLDEVCAVWMPHVSISMTPQVSMQSAGLALVAF